MTPTRRRIRRLPAAATLALAPTLAPTLAACGADATAELATVRDSAGMTIVENAPGADERVPHWTVAAEPSLRIGVVEGEAPYMFDRLWAGATLSDGRLVVIDAMSSQVRLFGRDGRIVAVQGREGDGPGEYRMPMGLWVLADDSIGVFDPQLARVTILHGASLQVARVSPLKHGLMNPQHAGTLDDGRRVVIMDMEFDIGGPIQPQYADVWTASIDDDAPADSVLRVVHGQYGLIPGGAEIGRPVGSPIWRAYGVVAARGDRIVHGSGEDHAIRVHDPGGGLRHIVRWHGPDRTVDRAEVDRWVDSVIALTPEERRPAQRRWYGLLPLPDRVPAHDRVLLDTAGRLWVSRWSPWDDRIGTYWWVFDQDGRMVATAEMPARIRVLEIGEEYVLGRVEDELGVEYVVRTRLGIGQ